MIKSASATIALLPDSAFLSFCGFPFLAVKLFNCNRMFPLLRLTVIFFISSLLRHAMKRYQTYPLCPKTRHQPRRFGPCILRY